MIYVHVPFCRSFCTYCGFYSEICPQGSPLTAGWRNALLREIGERRDETVASQDALNTIYFGGGTPSVLPPDVFGEIAAALLALCPGTPREFTVEVNPDDVVRGGAGWARKLRDAGADRASMGVQSFDDDVLRWMNRRHSAADAVKAFRILREAGFDNISLDLIFGYPCTTFRKSLETAVELRPEHISAYQLSVEEGSALERMVEHGRFKESSQEECAAQYGMLCALLRDAGYEHYEISNFALPGRRAVHNSGYWAGLPYVGLGPGAHSYSGNVRSWNPDELRPYIDGTSVRGGETLSPQQMAMERIMLSLRTSDGIDAAFLRDNCRPDVLERLVVSGFLEISRESGNFRIPERYFFVSDNIIKDLI